MVTGASTADCAVILVDARKGRAAPDPPPQLHRLAAAASGTSSLAVNKMDLVDYSRDRFEEIEAEYRPFAGQIGMDDVTCIPVSALRGDNVAGPRARPAVVSAVRR